MAILLQVTKQKFLVAQTLVELELVEHSSVESRVDKAIIFVPLLILLPLEIYKRIGGVFALDPRISALHHSPDQTFVITLAQIILSQHTHTVSCLGTLLFIEQLRILSVGFTFSPLLTDTLLIDAVRVSVFEGLFSMDTFCMVRSTGILSPELI